MSAGRPGCARSVAGAPVGLLRARAPRSAGAGAPACRPPRPRRAAAGGGALRIPAAAWLLALALAAGCTSGGADTGVEACRQDPPLTWANFGQGWMDKHCVGCHSTLLRPDQRNGAPVGVDLDTWEGVVAYGARIGAVSLGESPTMPPGGGPSEEERRLLAEWLDCAVLPAAEGAE